MVIGTLYRPPDLDINKFNVSFDLLLTKLNRQKTKFILAGDYNINLLHCDKHSETEQFLNHIFSNSCLPAITRQTRFSATDYSLIDNIIYKIDKLQNNNNGTNNISRILISDVSDHSPIFYWSDCSVNRKNIIEKPKF